MVVYMALPVAFDKAFCTAFGGRGSEWWCLSGKVGVVLADIFENLPAYLWPMVRKFTRTSFYAIIQDRKHDQSGLYSGVRPKSSVLLASASA